MKTLRLLIPALLFTVFTLFCVGDVGDVLFPGSGGTTPFFLLYGGFSLTLLLGLGAGPARLRRLILGAVVGIFSSLIVLGFTSSENLLSVVQATSPKLKSLAPYFYVYAAGCFGACIELAWRKPGTAERKTEVTPPVPDLIDESDKLSG